MKLPATLFFNQKLIHMATIRGYIVNLHISRSLGKFTMVETTMTGSKTFNIFIDAAESLIDPTEMVRRNWMISQLQKGLSDGLEVTVEHSNDFLEAIALEGQHTEPEGTARKVGGTVKSIELGANFGMVTLQTIARKFPTGSTNNHRPPPDEFKDELFNIYLSHGYAVNIHEFSRRFQIITLLQQSLSQGLQITITYVPSHGAFALSEGRILQVGIASKP